MNVGSKLVFIVGPGGSGKSTAGQILAERLDYAFVDLDLVFCERIGIIGDYIDQHGYRAYASANSLLFDRLWSEHPSRTVFALSSGFLVHEDAPELVRKHEQLLERAGITVLLLPSESLAEAMRVIVPRQLGRGLPGLVERTEREKLARRFPRYKRFGDVKVFSAADPPTVVALMVAELARIGIVA